jgi:DHA1 family multidrug resistance protein-like MFS transporter
MNYGIDGKYADHQDNGIGLQLNTDQELRTYQKLLLTCCMVSFACNVGSYMRIPIVPLFARSLGADTFQVGLINSSFLFMAGLLSFPFGILSDRLGRKSFILSGALISASSSFLLYFCKTPMHMIWTYLIFGVGLAAFNPTMMSYVADISPASRLGRSYGWYTMALYGGMTLGPAAGGFIGHALGFRGLFLISGAFIFLMSWMVVIFIPQTGAKPVKPPKREKDDELREVLGNLPLLGCWLATLGSCFGYGTFMTFIPLYANRLGMNAGDIGLVFAVQALSNALSRMPFGYLSDRIAKRGRLILLGFLVFALAMAGFAMADNMATLLFCSSVVGAGLGILFTSLGALVSEVVPRTSRGLAMGGYNTCIYLGMMLSSLITGLVIRKSGFESGFYFTAVIAVLSAGLFYFSIRNYPAKRKGEGY